MIKRSLLKDSLLYTIGNALPLAASVVLLPFYANYLNATNYVALSFYIGISLLFQIIFSFSFEQYYGVIYTEIKHHIEKVKLLNGSMFLYLTLYGGTIILITLFVGEVVLGFIFDENIPVRFYPYGLLSVLTAFFNALLRVSMITYTYTQQSKIFFFANLTNFFATIIISLSGLLLFPDTLTGPIYGRFLSGVIVLSFNLWILKNNIIWKYEHSFIREFIRKSWALFAYSIVMWITGNIDRYFLKNYVDVNNLASYDLIMKCFIGIEFIQSGLSLAIISHVFNVWKKENKVSFTYRANRYFNMFIASITFFITLFVFVLPHFIQSVITNTEYYSAFKWIGIIAISYLLRTIHYPYHFAFLYSKKTFSFFLINTLAILLQVILSYFFIPLYGLLAAIWMNGFTKIITLLMLHFYSNNRIFEIQINYFKWFFIPVFPILIYSIFFLVYPEQMDIGNVLAIFVFLISIILVYKNEWKYIYSLLSNNKLFGES